MNIVGILTEFNPFHRGHAAFLQKIRAQLGEDTALVCVMSGNFVQRGEPAVFEKHLRAEAALRGGADLIFELPAARALASAERFAGGALRLFDAMGCVDFWAFGSESGTLSALEETARILDTPEFSEHLRPALKTGQSFAAARQAAAEQLLGQQAACLRNPNDLLGVEYLRALRRSKSGIRPMTLCRTGGAHDAPQAYSGAFCRQMLVQNDWVALEQSLLPRTLELYRRAGEVGAAPVTVAAMDRAILARLRTMTREEWNALPDCGEGLGERFFRLVPTACSAGALADAVKTKRYAHARLRRIIMCAYLGITAAAAEREPAYLHLLGCNGRGRTVLAQMRRSATLPVLTKPAAARNLLTGDAAEQFALAVRTTDLYGLGCPRCGALPGGAEWTQNPVIVL